jgi:hypothetical protein
VNKTQVVGALLWRGGLLLAAAAALFESARWILRVVDIPPQLEIGFGLLLSGFVLVMVSLIVERIKDSRLESDLRE